MGVDQEILEVVDEYLAAFNACDLPRLEKVLKCPLALIGNGEVSISERYFIDFDKFIAATGWDHSKWDDRRVVQMSDKTAHVAAKASRYRSDGSLIEVVEALYVLTKQPGGWKFVGFSLL